MSLKNEFNFLAINTAGKCVEVALNYNGQSDCIFDCGAKKAGETLLAHIDELINRMSAELQKLDFIAVAIGPGSFTGIRIGLVTARTLCQALKKSLLTLTYPEILSYNIQSAQKNILTLSDAGNGYIYAAKFDAAHQSLAEPICMNMSGLNELLLSLPDYQIVAESHDLYNGKDAVLHKSAQPLLKAAKAYYISRGAADYRVAEPLYIRQPQAILDLQKAKQS